MKKILLLLLSSIFLLFSCGGTPTSLDSINPESQYIYFYGKNCVHCANLEEFFQENAVYEKISIEKREITANVPSSIENRKFFLEEILERDLNAADIGTPFIVERATTLSINGTNNIIPYFEQKLSELPPVEEKPQESEIILEGQKPNK